MRVTRLVVWLALAGSLLMSPVTAVAVGQIPVPLEGLPIPQPPSVSAETWLVFDETFDQVLASQDPDVRRPMASTTKMMTALVVLAEVDVTDRVVISQNAADAGESEIGLYAGESVSVNDLLHALLLQSANDAAIALAEHVGGSVGGFVEMMNDQVVELGLENTQFVNPHGLDADGHFSSATDLLAIARVGLDDPTFARIVQTTSYDLPVSPDGVARTARLTNELVRTYQGAFGVKTGFTDGAGLTLVAGADRDGRRIFAVVMGSEDHFADSARLLDFGFEAFTVLSVFDVAEQLGVIRSGSDTEPALAESPVDVFAPSDNEIVSQPQVDENGVVIVAMIDDEVVGSTAIQAPQMTPLPSLRDSFSWAGRYWNWLWGLDESA